MQQPTFEQIPTFLLGIGEMLNSIEEKLLLIQNRNLTECEKPINVDEAAEFLDLEKPTIYAMVQSNSMPFHKPFRKLFFFKSELNNWIKSNN